MTAEQRDKIAALAAEFFEKTDDLISVSRTIELVIEHRQELLEKRELAEAKR